MSHIQHLYSEDNIQNTAESIYAIAEILENQFFELLSYVEETENMKPFNQENLLGLLMALKQLSKPLI